MNQTLHAFTVLPLQGGCVPITFIQHRLGYLNARRDLRHASCIWPAAGAKMQRDMDSIVEAWYKAVMCTADRNGTKADAVYRKALRFRTRWWEHEARRYGQKQRMAAYMEDRLRKMFTRHANFLPDEDQPRAIEHLVSLAGSFNELVNKRAPFHMHVQEAQWHAALDAEAAAGDDPCLRELE